MPRSRNTPDSSPAAADKRRIFVRMYNVGFGDAFLVSIAAESGRQRILFDCGSIEAADGLSMEKVVDRIVRDVTDADGVPRIDIVVASHRHKDHVSGFGQAAWDRVFVKEVWMPWTEHPTDPDARRIRDIQSNLALGLQASLAAQPEAAGGADMRYRDIVTNSLMLSNERAMRTLHSGFAGNPRRRFLPGKTEDQRTFTTEVLQGVKVHVMGPSRRDDVIRDMEPPKGKTFLRMNAGATGSNGALPSPFPAEFRSGPYGDLTDVELDDLQRAGSLSDLAVAVALDKAVNGTSLMIMLEVSGTHLLFPGDAQWGTWDVALKDPEWNDLLKRVSFFKIGHHGSHNATPKEFVEEIIPSGVCAMASTLTRKIWPEIPKLGLLTGLVDKKAQIARSDQEAKAGKPFKVDAGVIEAEISL